MDTEPIVTEENEPLITPASVADRNSTPTAPKTSVIPTLVSVMLLGPALLALLFTIVLGHATTSLPRIGDCGTKAPESLILGFGFAGLGGFLVRMSRLSFNFIEGALPDSNVSHLSLSLCILCAFSVFGISLSPLSKYDTPEKSAQILDELSCILCLSLSLLCVLIHLAALRTDSHNSQEESIPSWKSVLVGVGVISASAFIALRATSFLTVRSGLEWTCLISLGWYLGSMGDKITDDVVRKRPRIAERDAKTIV